MYILGINAYHGDAAAALIKDGRIVAAVEEERFNRVKHCAGFPAESVRYCLRAAGIGIEEVAHVGISRDPSAHLHKKILFAASRAAKQRQGQTAGGRRQKAEGRQEAGQSAGDDRNDRNRGRGKGEWGIGKRGRGDGEWEEENGGNGQKRGLGIFAQVKDRLNNAAKVRDLKDDLARALGASKVVCARSFITSNTIARIWPARFMFHRLSARRCFRSTASATSSRRCGPWEKGTRSRCWTRWSIPTRPASFTRPPRSSSVFLITAMKAR